MTLRTVDDTVAKLKMTPRCSELLAPTYTGWSNDDRPKIALGVYSMREHTSNEGFVLTEGLRHAGWQVHGHGFPEPCNMTDVRQILKKVNPSVVFMNDIREWGEHCGKKDFRDPMAKFTNIEALGERTDIFKVGVSKDSHNSVELCNDSFRRAGVHCFQHTYHPRIVKHVNPGVRMKHLIRSWHSIEPADVPPFDKYQRNGCILSGALSPVYPLRQKLFEWHQRLPLVHHHAHPGYQRNKCHTPDLLDKMSRFKVAMVTSSVFGYSLRKFVEATAAGCQVITDLPTDEVMPEIDHNFVRVSPEVTLAEMRDILAEMYRTYDPERQRDLSARCKRFYDWRAVGKRLSQDIETARIGYNS